MSFDLDSLHRTPNANPGPATNLWTTAGAEKVLAASGAYTHGDVVVDVRMARQIHLEIFYRAGAAGGYPILLPQVSIEDNEPTAIADVWTDVPVSDGVVTTTVLGGAVPSGAAWTQNPGKGLVDLRGLAIKPMAAAIGTADRLRMSAVIRVDSARWFQVAVAERGLTATPGYLRLRYSLTV
jgi:hypothetical protein